MRDNKKDFDLDISVFYSKEELDLTASFEATWGLLMNKVKEREWSRKQFEDKILPLILSLVASWDDITATECVYISDHLPREYADIFESFAFQSVSSLSPETYAACEKMINDGVLDDVVSKDIIQKFKNFSKGQYHLWRYGRRKQACKAIRKAFDVALEKNQIPGKIDIKSSSHDYLKDIGAKIGGYFADYLLAKGWSEKQVGQYSNVEDLGQLIFDIGLDIGVFYNCEPTK